MSIFNRDYNSLTSQEQLDWDTIKQKETTIVGGQPSMIKKNFYREYPLAARHYISLFPNNFLDAVSLKDKEMDFTNIVNDFELIIQDKNTTERTILNFIRDKEAFFIIGSLVKENFNFGHHSLYIFPEFPLSTDYKADYLLVGKNSDGYHFVFIELENPHDSIVLKDGTYGETLRKGIKQIEDWKIWLEQNYPAVELIFNKSLKQGELLPNEFRKYDSTRINYVVIGGRRDDFTEKTYRQKRNDKKKDLFIFHYDNIADFAKRTIGSLTY